jgi:hypothetical protein
MGFPDMERLLSAAEQQVPDSVAQALAALLPDYSRSRLKGWIESGSAAGNTITLKLKSASPATTITYLDGASWKPGKVLRGANGIAALTFCEVPLAAPVR